MKICLRYPNPKSFPSGKGLAIASLKVFVCLIFYLLFKLSVRISLSLISKLSFCHFERAKRVEKSMELNHLPSPLNQDS